MYVALNAVSTQRNVDTMTGTQELKPSEGTADSNLSAYRSFRVAGRNILLLLILLLLALAEYV